MDAYNVLRSLPQITRYTDEAQDRFLVMTNNTTHEDVMLQEPEYAPAYEVDNTDYEQSHSGRFTLNGRTLNMETELHYAHYQTNMAALIQLGLWFDELRANGVYDNTRIILVSDHGFPLGQIGELITGDGLDVSGYYALLMVKDFNSTELTTSDAFMTLADVPAMAAEGVIENPANPFTGKALDSSDKSMHGQYLIVSGDWSTIVNNGTTFLPADWVSVHDDIWDRDNWAIAGRDTVLTDER